MFKFVILFLVAVYVLELVFMRKRRRMVRDMRTLVRYMVFAALLFTGFTGIPNSVLARDSLALQALALIVWALASYGLSKLFVAMFLDGGR